MDFFKSVISIFFSVLAMVCLFGGVINDAALTGLLGFGMCIAISIKCLSTDPDEILAAVIGMDKQKQ